MLYDDLAETYATGRYLFDTTPILREFAGPLPPGALLLALATREYTGQDAFDGERAFLGRRLPYSHDRPAVALGKLAAAGLAVVSAWLIETGGETFYWVIARKPHPAEGDR